MKKILILVALVMSATTYAAKNNDKEYLVDEASSGYFIATYVSEGGGAVMKLQNTLGAKFLVPAKDCKIIAEKVSEISGFKSGDQVLFVDSNSVGDYVRDAKIVKIFSNSDALIFVKDYKENGFHPYTYTSIKNLSLKY